MGHHNLERYRSGHNGAVLKTVRVLRLTRVRIPSSPPNKKESISIDFLEKYSSGWRGSPAKGVDPFKRDARVQIPPSPPYAQIAQSVEQGTENPRVGGSIPPLGTKIARLIYENYLVFIYRTLSFILFLGYLI